ncbi:class I SAM-dependent methyltransferase [Hyalangium rubrum]|uniref:Class I SAM-dependent methyltransferase n=1 Tax=Hyalangium rubrum TaxID=3103134 RepID=A0ABU5HDP5_9BACT|nr:class I SAM-dependent methyltransferase [Hyalangium sp. s54d21]MDY7231476.1 class I SAM-dependent methyltransferase [Hyalangium sp. s54d21]
MRVPLAVTTSARPREELVTRARASAKAWGVPFFPRRSGEGIADWFDARAEALIVFGHDGVTLWDKEGHHGFHAGMAHLRRMRLAAGEGDTFVRVAELRKGDAVLDCTLGLGQDALVASLAVGPTGRVVGVEKNLALYALASAGMKTYAFGPDSCHVEVVHADAHEHLRTLPPRSFDVVFFDPMFARPGKAQPGFDVLRRFADHAPLTPETLEEGRRVARRWVVVKGARYTDDLRKLGLQPEPGSHFSDVVWGRVGPSEGSP